MRSIENNNCDGSGPHTSGEVRVLPTCGNSNAILCRSCYGREIAFRIDRNRELEAFAQFKLPEWNDLDTYSL